MISRVVLFIGCSAGGFSMDIAAVGDQSLRDASLLGEVGVHWEALRMSFLVDSSGDASGHAKNGPILFPKGVSAVAFLATEPLLFSSASADVEDGGFHES